MARVTVSAEQRIINYHQAKAAGDLKTAQTEYKKIMKIASQRLVDLEKTAKAAEMVKRAESGDKKAKQWVKSHYTPKDVKYYGDVLKYSYASAMRDLQKLTGGNRFDVKVQNQNQERSLMAIAQRFLLSPTSSKSSIKQIYQNRAKSFNSKFNTNFTWQDFAKFVESKEFQDLMNNEKYSSNAMAVTIGKLKKVRDPEKIIDKIKSGSEQTTFTDSPDDEIAKRMIKEGIFDEIVNKL